MKINCEILSPVGRLQDMPAVIDAGADAVYTGLKGFSARPSEADLTLDSLKRAREITAKRKVKLYIAINGMVRDEQFEQLLCQIYELEKEGMDSIILSDPGLLFRLHEEGCRMPIHASTLMGIYNTESALLLKKMGVKRVILSSDFYIGEIGDLIRACPELEYEIVADGGICFNSNRQCMLPHFGTMEGYQVGCQLDYNLVGKEGIVGKAKRIGNCPAKIHRDMGIYLGLGITSFKIEGRTNPLWYILKRTEEVKQSRDYYMNRIKEIPGYMHYIYRTADWGWVEK